ncbi:hypothetical protein AAES_04513 [Amazona aestiva]|uniref:Uncharacterized protein n=1 Tax=Amazona aestiva TaxID=12930 RepID=A0A0Q3XAB8_AMAAE|nr:hypothetical protein AAES_04513 [Amazona aestiva]
MRPLRKEPGVESSFQKLNVEMYEEALPLFPEVVALNGINASGPSNVKDWILPYMTERCDTYNGGKIKRDFVQPYCWLSAWVQSVGAKVSIKGELLVLERQIPGSQFRPNNSKQHQHGEKDMHQLKKTCREKQMTQETRNRIRRFSWLEDWCSHHFGNCQQHPQDSTAFAEQAAAEMIMSNQHAVLSFPCLMILTLGELF